MGSSDSNKRILFMMPQYQAYSEVWLQRMLRGLGSEVALIASMGIGEVYSDWSHIPHLELKQVPRGGKVLHRVSPVHPWYYRFQALQESIRRHKITHVLCHFGTLAVLYLPVWKRVRAQVFVHFHGFDATFDLRSSDGKRPVHSERYVRQIRELSQHATFIVASRFLKEQLIAIGVPEQKIAFKVISAPVPEKPHIYEDRKPVRISFVGRFIDAKAPDKLIEAFCHAVSNGLDGALSMVGDGPLLTTCRQLVEQLELQEQVRFEGVLSSSQVQSLYRSTDIYAQHNVTGALTRQTESFGVSVLEAMMHGIPVACTRSGGVPETVGAENADLLVEPGDVKAHGELIWRLGTDFKYRVEAGRRCRAHASSRFTLEDEMRQLRAILYAESANRALA